MTTKNNTQPAGFETWEKQAKSFADTMLETTRQGLQQTIAMSERMAELWLDAARKAQELSLKETEAALALAEDVQSQWKTASDRMTKMVKEFSAN